MGLQVGYYDHPPVQRNATGSPASVIVPTQTSHHRRPEDIWWVSIVLSPSSSTYLSAPRPSISLILGLIAPPPSHTSPSRTQPSSAAPILPLSKLAMHRYVRIAFFRFPFVNFAHITHAFSLLFFPNNAHAPNPPCIIASAAGLLTTSVAVLLWQPPTSILSLSPNTTRCPISFVHDGRQDQATQLAAQQRPPPKSHSPAPLRTLLQL